MSTIPPVGSSGNPSDNTPKNSLSISPDTFLKMYVAQVKNQDPTKPMDTTQSLMQLAQMSSLQQSELTNKKLDALLSSASLSQADGIIGRTVTSADGKVTGVVESVKIYDDGLIATLKGGAQVMITSGIVVS